MKPLHFILFALSILSVVSCTNETPTPDPTPEPIEEPIEIILPKVEITDTKSIVLSEKEEIVATEAIDFGFDYLRAFIKSSDMMEEDNVITSPLSSYIALAILTNGATDETLDEFHNVISKSNMDISEINSYCYKMHEALNVLQPGAFVEMANVLFTRDDKISLNLNYKQILNQYFKSEFFSISSQDAMSQINEWARNKTHGLIDNLIDENQSLENVLMVICNSLYFDASWYKPFWTEATTQNEFNNIDNTTSIIDFLSYHDDYPEWEYYENENLQLLSLPFGNKDDMRREHCSFDMHVILPSEDSSIYDFLNNVTASEWQQLLDNRSIRAVFIDIPKMDVKNHIDLMSVMKELGIARAFTADAEFFNMCEENVMIDKFQQKNVFKMHEQGVTAAAVSEVEMVSSGTSKWEMPVKFNANRPFVFLITERSTGGMLYAGIVKTL